MDRGYNNLDILSNNRSNILRYLLQSRVCTRAQLSKFLKLTPASITKTVAGLIDCGLVEETGFIQGEKGRRSVGITLSNETLKVIGVKLSRRNYAVGVFDMVGNNISTRTDTIAEDDNLANILHVIKNEILNYIDRYKDIVAIGMAVPGPFLEKEGHIMLVTETKGWSEINLQEYYADSFPVPMVIKHDANSVALAEWLLGSRADDHSKTIVSFLIGEGIGAGVIIDGTVLSGSNGIACEVGHVSLDINGPRCDCGNYGCLELFCSSLNFVKHAKEQLQTNSASMLNRYAPLTYEQIFEAARLGDKLAISLVQRAGRYIGYGSVNLIIAYDPDVILISSDLSGGGPLLLDEVRRIVNERTAEHISKNVRIEFSRLQGDSILYGAGALAIDYCLQNPEHLLEKAKETQQQVG